VTRDEIFDAVLESEAPPEIPRAESGRTLPFVKTRAPLDEIYRLSVAAEKPAEMVLRAARSGPDELAAAMRALDGKPYRGFALLYAAQKGTSLGGMDPRKVLSLARAIGAEAASLEDVNREARATTPAPRQAIQAEAHLLESQALVMTGDPAGGRTAVASARDLFVEAGDAGFGAALCDYYEGEAATFGRDYATAERLIRSALTTFEEYGQDFLLAKALAAMGTVLENQGNHAAALPFFSRAVMLFDPERDARPLTMTLNNRANALAQMGRFDEARATYAKALTLALRNDFSSHLRYIRSGLAELDFLRGQYPRALRNFREIAAESAANGSPADVLFARLYVAECLGRTGQFDAMAAEVDSLRHDRKKTVFSPSPALGELFVCLDQGTIDADLVAHVREYLQDEENGIERKYQPLRMVG
jgi:tetratricopeptide (TPR) repeat protein